MFDFSLLINQYIVSYIDQFTRPIFPDLETSLRNSGAWSNPEARATIEVALPKIREAEEADNRDEVDRLLETLNMELKGILRALPSATSLPEDSKHWCEALLGGRASVTMTLELSRQLLVCAPR